MGNKINFSLSHIQKGIIILFTFINLIDCRAFSPSSSSNFHSTLLNTSSSSSSPTSSSSSSSSASSTIARTRFSIESNSIQRQLLVVEAQTERDSNRSLKRVFLSNRTITCNDGSQAGFYLRKSSNSKKWIVFLEGGWHCYDTKSCRSRWLKLRHLMTSTQWPETRDIGGILSPLFDENPYWYNANHVLVPYCSSDSWSGTKMNADTRDGWRFMGSLIVRQVISDLIPLGLGRPSRAELLLVGSSAGGLGVMLNLDQINDFLQNEKNLNVLVRGISDSGWFLDREPYTPGAVAASEAVRQGWKMWEGAVPESCLKQHSNEPWRCYFGHRLYPTLKSSLFIFQWLFDEAQMRADNVGAPVTPQQWNYIHDMGGALRTSLDNVTAVFAPSCIGHAVLSKRDWLNIKIDDISLPEALRCWERATSRKHNKLRRASEVPRLKEGGKRKRSRHQRKKNSNDENLNINTETNKSNKEAELIITEEGGEPKHLRRRHNERKRNHRRLRTTENPQDGNSFFPIEEQISNGTDERNNNRKRKKSNNSNNKSNSENFRNHTNNIGSSEKNSNSRERQRNHSVTTNHRHQRQHSGRLQHKRHRGRHALDPKKCSLRLLERCSWPQCNHSCPTLTNPLTGEEMRFLELLASFGLDIEAVAAALGVDMQTLNNMDHTELVSLLTQQVS